MPLPPFSFEAAVSADTARQDKVEIMADHGTSFDEAGEVALFLHYLGGPPSHSDEESAAFGRIFCRPRRQVPPFADQQIRRRSVGRQPGIAAPLFSGLLRVIGSSAPWRVATLVSLNPTRFVRHQVGIYPTRMMQLEGTSPTPCLFRADVPSQHEGEFALMDQDNWIPDNRRWERFASPRLWPRHLRYYVSGALGGITSDIQRAAVPVGVSIERATRNWLNVLSVETYWEFAANDPTGAVRSLEPWLSTYASAQLSSADYPVQSAENVENSRRISLQTRIGETLKIYAKTNRRIRFEVTHCLGGNSPFRLRAGGHTFSDVDALLGIFSQLAECAASRVNSVLHHFRCRASTPEAHKPVLWFVADVLAACDTPSAAREILQVLVNNGSIVVGAGSAFGIVHQANIARLARKGVLVSSNRRYAVTAPYRRALEQMQSPEAGFLLDARRRRRNS